MNFTGQLLELQRPLTDADDREFRAHIQRERDSYYAQGCSKVFLISNSFCFDLGYTQRTYAFVFGKSEDENLLDMLVDTAKSKLPLSLVQSPIEPRIRELFSVFYMTNVAKYSNSPG